MRWDSPMVLVIAGTVAIHTLLVVFVDAIIVTHPLIPEPPPPVVEMVDVEVDPPPPPPPPTPPPPLDMPETRAPDPQPQPRLVQRTQPRAQPTPPPETPPIPGPPGDDDPPTYKLDPGDRIGMTPPPARAPRSGNGRGGSGGGTGGGSGSGAGTPPPPPPPVSVATIKTRALPKGDYGYIDAGKDYPVEARQLGIEGPIRVKLVVDAGGKVRSAVLLNQLGHGLDELALARAKAIEFEPARDTDDKPVTSVVIWTFNMTLPK